MNSALLEAPNIIIRETRDDFLTDFGKATLSDRYCLPGESYQEIFVRVANAYSNDMYHAQRLYDYMSKLWFMPATPILSNGGTTRGLPISCFLNETEDNLTGIADLWYENVWLSSMGGGVGSYWGNIRSIGEKVHGTGRTSGIIPFVKVQDAISLAVSQGGIRRGSSAVYLPVGHPEIEEFLDIRKPSGGDPNRKSLNVHHAVIIDDAFMEAVLSKSSYPLRSPKDNSIIESIDAQSLWGKILISRIETGEPYILFIDNVNKKISPYHKELGLHVKTSNLCSEITLPTGRDHLGNNRTAVCCLSSLNLEYFDEWEENEHFIEDIMYFLDNVLEDFIARAPSTLKKAKYSAQRERSVGLGVMGFHSYLQSKNIPFESERAALFNKSFFSSLERQVSKVSEKIGHERGACSDVIDALFLGGIEPVRIDRFVNKTAIAPTASISIICGGASPGVEPILANGFTQKTLSGSFSVKNKHLDELIKKKIDRLNSYSYQELWSEIVQNNGSIQHLDVFTEQEKAVFKTAQEIDQTWVIRHATDRTPYIDQSQSVNLFIPANVSKKELHRLHVQAWRDGLKSLYYLRSTSLQRPEKNNKSSACSLANQDCESCQ